MSTTKSTSHVTLKNRDTSGRKANAVLNDFGMEIPKVTGPQTLEAKALAKAKRAATRAARHTMGSVQKKAITGNVVAVTMTPVMAGAPVPSTARVTPEPPAGATTQVG